MPKPSPLEETGVQEVKRKILDPRFHGDDRGEDGDDRGESRDDAIKRNVFRTLMHKRGGGIQEARDPWIPAF